jgi:DNA-binding response OmpR family regulator
VLQYHFTPDPSAKYPFNKFLAKLRSVMRLVSFPRTSVLRVGDLVLDSANHVARRAGDTISLSRTEFRLLEVLMRRAGRVVSRNTIVHSFMAF